MESSPETTWSSSAASRSSTDKRCYFLLKVEEKAEVFVTTGRCPLGWLRCRTPYPTLSLWVAVESVNIKGSSKVGVGGEGTSRLCRKHRARSSLSVPKDQHALRTANSVFLKTLNLATWARSQTLELETSVIWVRRIQHLDTVAQSSS